ncbi:MAG: hypothetical protein K0R66_1505 [Gammaproteobacteria bacterium]|jgi:uncharacterized protein YecE (DUF72 family)|nr:hypothetical protein [Gammaproteobacteria bacterium]
MDIHIGCSGYQYKEWKGGFYPERLAQSKWLAYYAERFNSVEINSSFYRFPQASSLEKWYKQVPDGFTYSLKAPRFITHYHKFIDSQRMLNDFYRLADILQEKLGCILFQLPESLSYNEDLLNRMLDQLDPRYKNVIEFRHPSWWQDTVYQALKRAKVSFCQLSGPKEFNQAPIDQLFYLRFHGSQGWYCGSHANELKAWFNKIKDSKAQEAWIYFNNTMNMDAVNDGEKLRKLFES